jgi:Tfp pilus assembly protein PilN
MRAVNLLTRVEQSVPWRDRASERLQRINPLWAAAAAAGPLLVISTALFLSASSSVSSKRTELEAKQAERAAIVPASVLLANQRLDERRQREAALAAALVHRVAWDRVLRRVSQILPAEASLISITAEAPTSPAPEAGAAPEAAEGEPVASADRFTLTGLAPSQDVAARSLIRLRLVPELADLRLVSSTKTTLGSRPVVQFTIAGNVAPRGASQ